MSLERVLARLQRERQQLTDDYRRKVAELDEDIDEVRLRMNHNDRSGTQSFSSDIAHAESLQANEQPVNELVLPNEWKGLKIADGLNVYLNKKESRAAKVEPECVEVLLRGGVDLGRPERHGQNIRISIRANLDRFEYNRETDIVELKQ